MIKLKTASEPSDFDEQVRRKGMAFLAASGLPKRSEDWRGHEYWRYCADDLYKRKYPFVFSEIERQKWPCHSQQPQNVSTRLLQSIEKMK